MLMSKIIQTGDLEWCRRMNLIQDIKREMRMWMLPGAELIAVLEASAYTIVVMRPQPGERLVWLKAPSK